MASYEAKVIRDHLMSLKVWVEHWKADAASNLTPTAISLMLAQSHAENALTMLDRMEDEQKVAA
jgi:hypothetical protein